MEYRTNRRTGDSISIIGLGSGSLHTTGEREAIAALCYAYEHGINYMDFAAAGAAAFGYAGKAFSSVRGSMLYQVHFGTDYKTGEYGWTTDLDTIKRRKAFNEIAHSFCIPKHCGIRYSCPLS